MVFFISGNYIIKLNIRMEFFCFKDDKYFFLMDYNIIIFV